MAWVYESKEDCLIVFILLLLVVVGDHMIAISAHAAAEAEDEVERRLFLVRRDALLVLDLGLNDVEGDDLAFGDLSAVVIGAILAAVYFISGWSRILLIGIFSVDNVDGDLGFSGAVGCFGVGGNR